MEPAQRRYSLINRPIHAKTYRPIVLQNYYCLLNVLRKLALKDSEQSNRSAKISNRDKNKWY